MTIFVKTAVPSETEIRAMDTAKCVDRGIRLQRIITRANEELEKIKVVFRDDAAEMRKVLHGQNPIHFIGRIGEVKVTFKGDSLKAVKDKDTTELKNKIPAAIYHNLFDEVTVAVPAKGFKEKLKKLSPETCAAVMEYFASVPNTPSVEFSK